MVNYVSILVAAIVAYAFGMLYFSPKAFGAHWMKLSDMKKKDKPSAVKIILGFVSTLVTAYVLSLVLTYTAASNVLGAIKASLVVWAGFMGTLTLGSFLWEGKSIKLWVLNNIFNILQLVIISVIITIWV